MAGSVDVKPLLSRLRTTLAKRVFTLSLVNRYGYAAVSALPSDKTEQAMCEELSKKGGSLRRAASTSGSGERSTKKARSSSADAKAILDSLSALTAASPTAAKSSPTSARPAPVCFQCNATGHVRSACPQNTKEKK